MKIGIALLIIISVVLISCGRTQTIWVKDGQNYDYERDTHECRKEAALTYVGFYMTNGAIVGMIAQDRMFKSCMAARGYSLKKVPK